MDKTRYALMKDMESKHWWFASRRVILDSVLQQILDKEKKGKRDILEIGCGSGANFPVLSNYGSLYGVDINPKMVSCSSQKGLARSVCVGSLPDNLGIDCIPEFDFIFCGDVLEHIKENTGSFHTIWQRLKKDGLFLIFVPAHMWLWSENDVRSHHYYRYSKDSLKHFLEDAGFEVLRLSYFNSILFAPIFVMQKIRKIFGLPFDEMTFNTKFINSLLKKIFSSESFLLKHVNFPFGYSLMAVAKK